MKEPIVFGKAEYWVDALTRSLGFLTRVIHIQIGDRIRANRSLVASPATLAFLHLVDANPGIRQVHAARILLIHESNMAMLVKNLVAEGLIERREGTGKRSGLWIAAKGADMVAQSAAADVISREHAECLSDEEYQQLVALLDRVYRASL